MYKRQSPNKSVLKVNRGYTGETIEQKIRRIVNNKEPISDGAPLIYTDRKNGVLPEYDIRTDRFEVAIDAMDKVTKTHLAKREERHKPNDTDGDNNSTGGGQNGNLNLEGGAGEPTQ